MDQHRDADAAAVFEVHPADDWPYVRLTPHVGRTRATHEWMAANAARAKAREAARKAAKAGKSGRRRTAADSAPTRAAPRPSS